MLTTTAVLAPLIGDLDAAAPGTYQFSLDALRAAAQAIVEAAEDDAYTRLSHQERHWRTLEASWLQERARLITQPPHPPLQPAPADSPREEPC